MFVSGVARNMTGCSLCGEEVQDVLANCARERDQSEVENAG